MPANIFPNTSREVWEKIVSLGSPKTDRVLSMKKEDFPVLKEWEKLVRQKNGKRVILYNLFFRNSTAFLTERSKNSLFRKTAQYLAFLSEKKDILLWWRPHPLLSETFRRLDQELYEEYQKPIREYQTEGEGILMEQLIWIVPLLLQMHVMVMKAH